MADRSSIGIYRPDGQRQHDALEGVLAFPAFTFVQELRIRHDTLLAFDRGARLIHRIPLSGTGRTTVVPIGHPAEGVYPLPTGGYITHGNIRTPELIGLPIHVHDPTGRHVRAFGRPESVTPENPWDTKRNLALSDAGLIFAGSLNRYRIEQWRTDGTLVRTIDQRRTWFDAWTAYPPNIEASKPPPTFESLRVEDGLIWSIFHVPDGSWTPLPGIAEDEHSDLPSLAARNRIFDTIVEVIDARSGELVATRTVDQVISGYLNDGTNMYTTRTVDDSGNQEVHLLRLRLVRERD